MGSQPLYQRVKREIVTRIENGSWPRGSFIPPEPDLQRRYGVSRTTVRRAVEELVDEGQLVVIHGLGTRVVARELSLKPATLMSFTQMMLSQGVTPGRRYEELDVQGADPEVASALGIVEGTPVVRYMRVRTADGEPVSVNTSFLPADLFRGFDVDRLLEGESLYAQLENAYAIDVQTTQDTFGIGAADSQTAEHLETRVGEPLLIIARYGFDRSDAPIEYSRIAIRPDRYKHSITLRRK